MKRITNLALLLLLGVLSSCSNNELAYNEKATSLFLSEMNQIDDDQKAFADTAAVLHGDNGDVISLGIKADNIIDNAQRDIQNMNDLKPSEAAKKFHEAVLNYFNSIKAYGTTAKQLLAAKAEEKRTLQAQLADQYEKLDQMPDQVLYIQKQYLDQVGIKPK